MFYIFSEDGGAIKPFESKQSYSPFNIYTLVKHNGDWINFPQLQDMAGQKGERTIWNNQGVMNFDELYNMNKQY